MQQSKKNFPLPQAEITLNELINCLNDNSLINDYKNMDFSKILDKNSSIPVYFHSKDIEKKLNNTSNKIEFIYIARKGQKFDGHSLAEKVLYSGNIFVGEKESIEKIYSNKAEGMINHNLFIPVENCECALNCILENAFKVNPKKFFTIAVTGTNGKTSVTQITANLLENLSKENILKIGTLGVQFGGVNLPVSHVTTPDYPSFLNILSAAQNNNIRKVVLEYTSHGLKEKRLGDWLVDIAIFTNLTQDHLDYHKTMDDYRISKQKLFNTFLNSNGTAIININNNEWINFVEAARGVNKNLIIVGNKELHLTIKKNYSQFFHSITYLHIENYISNLQGIRGTIVVKENQFENEKIENSTFICPLIGEFQLENILCAVGVGIALKYPLQQICSSLNFIKNIPGRLEVIKASSQNNETHNKVTYPTVLIDYAHTPDALEKAIFTCRKTLPPSGKLITVFGCGGDRDPSKRPLMGNIAFTHSDIVLVTSDNPRTEEPNKIIDDIFHGIVTNEKWMREPDRKKAIQKAIALASKNDLVLVAGKGHEDYQIMGTTKYPFSDADVVKSILDHL